MKIEQMKFNKRYWLIVIPLIIILLLVVIRAFRSNEFSYTAREVHRLSLETDHFISMGQLEKLQEEGDILLVDIRESGDPGGDSLEGSVNVPLSALLDKRELSLLRTSKSTIVICSADMAMSASAWALLGQLGIRELYILELPAGWPGEVLPGVDAESFDDELPRYRFIPDTSYVPPADEPVE